MNMKRRTFILLGFFLVALLGVGLYGFSQIWRAFGVKDYRVVQILESADGRHTAQLIRKHSFLELNFIVHLNDEKIYTTPDFRPNNKVPFRETLAWDESGRYLVFEVGGERLFGYNIQKKQSVSYKELMVLKVRYPKFEEFGYAR